VWRNRRRIANDRQMAGNVCQHNGTSANFAVLPNFDWSEYLGIGANESSLPDVRMTPALIRHAPRPKGYAMKNGDVVLNDGRCPNNRTYSMINEDTLTNGCFGRDGNSGDFSGVLTQ
jgi:hypothetical protein